MLTPVTDRHGLRRMRPGSPWVLTVTPAAGCARPRREPLPPEQTASPAGLQSKSLATWVRSPLPHDTGDTVSVHRPESLKPSSFPLSWAALSLCCGEGAALRCRVQAARGGASPCRARAPGTQARAVVCTGLAAPRHVASSKTRG